MTYPWQRESGTDVSRCFHSMDTLSLSGSSTFSIKYEARPQVMMDLGVKREGHVSIGAVDNRPTNWAIISTAAS